MATEVCGQRGRMVAIVVAAILTMCRPSLAQDLEPRAYAANPIGAAFLLVGWAHSTGAVVTDPTLPVTDIHATIEAAPVGIGYTFDVAGKTAQAVAALPYAWGEVSGRVGEKTASVNRSGLTDMRVRFAVNLRGNDAMRAREFTRAPRHTIVGASVVVSAPTGQYYPDKLINLGTNRWAFRPEVGLSVPRGNWDIDAYLGAWFFTRNDEYYTGAVSREQRPLAALQGHAAYTFKPRMWVAGDATWYAGGRTTVGDGDPGPQVNNVRVGATLSLPVGRLQSIKVAYSTGATVRTGTDFRTFSVAYSRVWLTKL